jgi:hypothetical protein
VLDLTTVGLKSGRILQKRSTTSTLDTGYALLRSALRRGQIVRACHLQGRRIACAQHISGGSRGELPGFVLNRNIGS